MNHAHEKKVDELIKVWDERIAVLMARADKINSGQKLIYQEYLQSLQTRRQEVLEMISELFPPALEKAEPLIQRKRLSR